ncbi:hypothetical protein [Sorangium sp. So ce693]|uniref:hypothetical protein n=1 Tax=Sorangium sp. So ce693 TaxID=3133318 RepID=UPI003F6372FD
MRAVVGVLASLLAGCGVPFEAAPAPAAVCFHGQLVDCACPDGATGGVRACLEDRSGYGACIGCLGTTSSSSSASSSGGAGGQGGEGGDAATTASSSSTSSTSAGGEGGQGGGPAPECRSFLDCPGPDGPCGWRACHDGVCRLEGIAPEGTLLEEQTPGDCLVQRCDGRGGKQAMPAPADIADDGDDCTADACGPAGPTHELAAEGTPCSGGLCENGACVEYPVRCSTPRGIYVDCDPPSRDYDVSWRQPDGNFADCFWPGSGHCAPGLRCWVHFKDGGTNEGLCL